LLKTLLIFIMRNTKEKDKNHKKLQQENESLRLRLSEAEKKLSALNGSGQFAGTRTIEEASPQNKKLLTSVLDNVSSGVAMIDGEGKFTVYNSLFLKLFGLSADSTIKNVNDQNWAEWQVFDENGSILHVDDHPVRKASLTGKRVENQLVGVKLPSGGEITWMLISAEPIFRKNGDIERMICSYHDITELKRIGEVLAFQARLLSEVHDAVFSSDSRYIITYWNQAAERMFGWTKEEALGKNSGDLLKPKIAGSSHERERLKLKRAGHWEGEAQYVRKDGTCFFAEVNSTMLKDSKGIEVGHLIVCRDITESKKAEEALQISEEKFSRAFRYSPNAITITRISDGQIIEGNESAFKLLGYHQNDVVSKTTYELETWADPSEREKLIQRLESEDFIQNQDITLKRKDGTPVVVNLSASRILIDNQPCLLCSFIDITEQKRAEESVKKSEALYRAIGESIDYGIWICDADGKNIYASESYLKLVGLTQEQCSEFGWGDALHPDDREKTISAWKECSKTGGIWDIEHSFKGVDGKWHPILARGIPIRDDKGKIIMWAGINLDISKIKETENALRESEEKVLSILINSLDIIYRINLVTGKFEFISPSVETIMGYSQDEIMALDPTASLALVHPGDIDILLDAQAQSDKTGNGIAEYRQRTKNGEYRWLSNHMSIIKNNTGVPLYRDGNIRDITEHRRVEEAIRTSESKLREAQEKLNMALENANVGLWEWDLKSNEFFLDGRMEKMIGLEPGVFGNTYMEFENLINEEDIPHFQKALKRSLDNQFQFETIFRINTKNGKEKIFSTRALSNRDKEYNICGFTGVCFDITGMKEETDQLLLKLNKELLRSNKELQQFAYVASHDLQEPLRMISSFTQLLARKYGDKLGKEADEYINFVVDGAKRMHNLINALLSYSRIQTRGQEFTRLDMNLILKTALDNLSIGIAETKAVITFDDLPVISGDEGQITQVLQNLIGNAIKFNKNLPEIHVSVKEVNGNYIFSVTDNGIGIEELYFERIFAIFQRLDYKGEYAGTGIGLSICKSIVERHGGRIWVESEVGKGTTFFFTIN
jgi:PAS domain S-box-containing protein